MQKINFIIHFFLKILQRNSKLVILGNLGMPGHTHQKEQYELEEIFDVYLQAKNQLHYSCFSWEIAKLLQTCYFGYSRQAWLHKPIMTVSSWENFHIYLQAKEPLYPSCFSGDIAKICKLLILHTLGMSRYAHPSGNINL